MPWDDMVFFLDNFDRETCLRYIETIKPHGFPYAVGSHAETEEWIRREEEMKTFVHAIK
jgi:hypothetical protein